MKPLLPWDMPLQGTSLIEASAGTGKTYTLTTLYLRLLVEHDLAPADILVVTYTTAATAELRERVRGRIQQAIEAGERSVAGTPHEEDGDEEETQLRALAEMSRRRSTETGKPDRLRSALQSFDEAAIFTIHGFCQRTLQENAFESGLAFDAELVEQSEPIERTLAHDLFCRVIAGEPPAFIEWLLEGKGRRWQFEPDALYGDLLRSLGADETMPVVPGRPSLDAPTGDEASALTGQVERVVGYLREWAGVWRESGDRVISTLLGPNDLNGNKYRKKSIETKWSPELDALAAAIKERGEDESVASLPLPDYFEKLTNAGLAAGITKKDGEAPVDPAFTAFDNVFAAVSDLARSFDERALWLRHQFVDFARDEAARRRGERHQLFFDDLLSELRRGLEGERGEQLRQLLRARYRFALIDEFQDTDPVQYDVFRQVWHEAASKPDESARGLVLIGDPKQAIYSFRGADVFTYLSARADAGEAAYGLGTNYRSDPGLIESTNGIFAARLEAFQLEEIKFDPVAPRREAIAGFDSAERPSAGLRVLFADREQMSEATGESFSETSAMAVRYGRTRLMHAMATDVVRLLESGATIDGRSVNPSDIAVLCRRKIELKHARQALESVGIPCVDRGDADVFESREAWELACVLRAMLRSGDPGTLRSALASGAHGISASELTLYRDDSRELVETSERFAEYGRLWSQYGFSRAFETWRRREGVTARLLGYLDGERRLTNWLHLAELLQYVASERSPSRSGLVSALERAIASETARAVFGSEASLLRLERDDEAVSLVTLHRSKGLEYPIVILPSLWEDASGRGPTESSAAKGETQNPPIRFHDAVSGRRTMDLSGHAAYAEHVAQGRDEAFSEQLRLLYVGLTRARHQCIVGWGAFKGAQESPLAWLLDQSAVTEGLDRKQAAERRKKWTDGDWRGMWGGLVARVEASGCANAISIEDASFDPIDRWEPPALDTPALDHQAPQRRLGASIRTTSFSALTREGHRTTPLASGLEIEGRDLDANINRDGAMSFELEEPDGTEEATPDLAAEMDAFPRGAEAGTLLHDVLERVDLADVAAGRVPEEVLRKAAVDRLARNGLDDGYADQVLHVVNSVARTPLRSTPTPFCLGDVKPGQFRPEIEFTLVTPGDESGRGFDPNALADLLMQAPDGSPLRDYAERARGLGFNQLTGFLRGFIDAVFFDGEHYFLVDYKSNHLGNHQADYRGDALVKPMISHDYVLQYLLYAVALDRHLRERLEGYDYDVDFGGAYYLFLRGFAESHEEGCGVFFDRPPRQIIEGMSALMGFGRESRS